MKRAAAHLDAGAGCRLSLTESERTAGIWELGTAFQWQIVGLFAPPSVTQYVAPVPRTVQLANRRVVRWRDVSDSARGVDTSGIPPPDI